MYRCAERENAVGPSRKEARRRSGPASSRPAFSHIDYADATLTSLKREVDRASLVLSLLI